MKEIDNWKAVIKGKDGREKIALPLPGCIIKGDIEERNVEIEVVDMYTTRNIVIIDTNGQEYSLSGANREYIGNIETCIQIGERENGVER